jgi:hypothetical protein
MVFILLAHNVFDVVYELWHMKQQIIDSVPMTYEATNYRQCANHILRLQIIDSVPMTYEGYRL